MVDPAQIGAAVAKATEIIGEHSGNSREIAALVESATNSPEWQRAASLYTGRVVARQTLLSGIFSRVLQSLRVWSTYLSENLPLELAQRLVDIPMEEIVAPAPSLVRPIIEGISDNVEDPDLQGMYLNLLATAATQTTMHEVQPGLVNALRQLERAEAIEFEALTRKVGHKALLRSRGHVEPVSIAMIQEEHEDHCHELQRDLLNTVDENRQPREQPRIGEWVANWIYLGLCETHYPAQSPLGPPLTWCEARPEVARWRAYSSFNNMGEIRVSYGELVITARGQRFMRATQGLHFPNPEARKILKEAMAGPFAGKGSVAEQPTPDGLDLVASITAEAASGLPSPVFETAGWDSRTRLVSIGYYPPLSQAFKDSLERSLRSSELAAATIEYVPYGSQTPTSVCSLSDEPVDG